MKLYGEPNRIIQRRVKRQGQWRIIQWFEFDANGMYEIDENTLSDVDRAKLVELFGTDTGTYHSEYKAVLNEEENKQVEYTEEEIRKIAKKKGIKSWHVISIEKLKTMI